MGEANAGLDYRGMILALEADTTLVPLVRGYIPTLDRRLRKYLDPYQLKVDAYKTLTVDDLLQECLIAIVEAARKPDILSFHEYAQRSVTFILRETQKQERTRQVMTFDMIVTDLWGDRDVTMIDIVDDTQERELDDAVTTVSILDFVKLLTPKQRRILHYLLCGNTQSEIARLLGTHRNNVNNAVKLIQIKAVAYAQTHDFGHWLQYIQADKGGEHVDA